MSTARCREAVRGAGAEVKILVYLVDVWSCYNLLCNNLCCTISVNTLHQWHAIAPHFDIQHAYNLTAPTKHHFKLLTWLTQGTHFAHESFTRKHFPYCPSHAKLTKSLHHNILKTLSANYTCMLNMKGGTPCTSIWPQFHKSDVGTKTFSQQHVHGHQHMPCLHTWPTQTRTRPPTQLFSCPAFTYNHCRANCGRWPRTWWLPSPPLRFTLHQLYLN